ncbi:MprA protease, GlyGly-CTERM protein-sorting domain-containing form [Cupriavidus sp. DB3]|uniref:MprA protease, GlyGly-CTERM protein-sorting domain-containing form n=1 Tax=Cupriavidus sp. DB3 TaxID=2873259 RepID=UPI001CF35EA7|nr:MprA protease, GlyGly-CTERM protein-sorting domain-containing form [Cupriavidus sp. DB3]MCA7086230.1 MprA protease, GlyGly-CTERM protein-sorting domain-containing form [Cupriavidus sp. DB3]
MPRSIPPVALRLVLAAAVSAGAILPPSAAMAATSPDARPAPVYSGNIIVRWKDAPAGTALMPAEAAAEQVRKVAEQTGIGLTVKRQMGGNLALLGVPAGKGADPEAVAAQLRQDPRVADAVPDRWLRPHDTVPNDPEFAINQPYFGSPAIIPGAANLPAAWDRSRGSEGLVIAVVDTGVLRHPDLAARLVAGYDFIADPLYSQDGDGRDGDPTDAGDFVPQGFACPGMPAAPNQRPSTWHGTRVASVLGAVTNNGQDIAGVDWSARIQPLRVSGRCGALLSDTVDAMRWAGGLPVPNVPNNPTPARVVNISLGAGTCSSFEQQAVDELAARGVVVVAAAGNSAGAVEAPADCRGVIAVTAHVNDGENASYANVGPQIAISAPGGGCANSKVSNGTCLAPPSTIRTLTNDGETTARNYTLVNSQGTSFAAPMVSGVASLMLAVNGNLTSAQVTELLKSSARPHPANTYCTTGNNAGNCGAGLLDANRALAAAAGAPVPPAPPPANNGGGGDDGGGGAVPLWSGAALALAGLFAVLLPSGRRRQARR